MVTQTPNSPLDFVVLTTAQTANQSNKILDESITTHWQRLTGKAALA